MDLMIDEMDMIKIDDEKFAPVQGEHLLYV